jgi:glycosyltransferase involved in cell wall biosynthesis
MMMKPLISVVVVAYNRRGFLLSALRSIVNQSFKDYEVIVAKNFHDLDIDDFIKKHGFREIFIDTKRYGEQIAAAVEETKGDIIAFLEDDDEFEQDKLHWIGQIFNKYNAVSFFHDTRKYINDKGELIQPSNPKYRQIVLGLEKITPHKDIIINPNNLSHIRYLLHYYGAVSTVSLMSIRAECIKSKIKHLKDIEISVEASIPTIASECGLLYHTSRRLTRYRIHNHNTSIPFNEIDKLRRLFYNLRRAINDHELIIKNTSKNNYLKLIVKLQELEAKYILSTSNYKDLFNDALIKPYEVYELCKLEKGYVDKYYENYKLLYCIMAKLIHLIYASLIY